MARTGRRRGRQEGSIYQRADGRWTAAVSVGWRSGKRKRKQLYGKTRQEVQQRLTKVLNDQNNGLPIAADRQTLGQFLNGWLENSVRGRVRPKTLTSYRQLVKNHLIPCLGNVGLSKLTPQHVEATLTDLIAKGLSGRTVQYIRSVLRRALCCALKWNLVARNVAALVDAPRTTRREVEPFTVEEIPRLLDAFEGERLSALYLLALTHGLRQGEALGLRWADVDLADKTLRVRHALQWIDGAPQFVETKTKQSNRGIALSEHVVKALKSHRKTQLEDRMKAGDRWTDHALVFATRTGGPLDGINVTRDFKRMLKKAGLPIRRFHDLRHTTASLLLHQRVHPRVVMDLLGHSEIRVTMDLYSHVAPVLQREAADEMDALLIAATTSEK
jgi:integrase